MLCQRSVPGHETEKDHHHPHTSDAPCLHSAETGSVSGSAAGHSKATEKKDQELIFERKLQ